MRDREYTPGLGGQRRGYPPELMLVLAALFLRRDEPAEEVERELLHILSPEGHPLQPQSSLPR